MKKNDSIYKELERRIIELTMKPGEIINEKELAQEFDVSRTPVREALLKLAEKELVEIIPRKGTYVSQIDIKKIKNTYEIKMYLEALAASLAAERATDEEVEEMLKVIEELKKLNPKKDYKKYIELDQLFHKLTRDASRNSMLIEYLENLNIITERFLQYIQYVVSDSTWYIESVILIAQAIKDRDSKKASKEAEEHVVYFLKELSQRFFM
ncbi:GntR family transcriptional regulator [Tepiditoga spiralis]|uniref:GntR family transcriptional regulator n=1 Tax=Tepiditoga spiralis TaxID=2108365 RepID=A0A7G1G281_9BACT|nr:GntR family transcriptional regulator [Tepiditoga spiralis]BBE29965.1 GntR family transcriptional regulator [Tepiditoga spiralis]